MDDGASTEAWIYMLREWRDDIYNVSSALLESYNSKGDHGREYVDRLAKDTLKRISGSIIRSGMCEPKKCLLMMVTIFLGKFKANRKIVH